MALQPYLVLERTRTHVGTQMTTETLRLSRPTSARGGVPRSRAERAGQESVAKNWRQTMPRRRRGRDIRAVMASMLAVLAIVGAVTAILILTAQSTTATLEGEIGALNGHVDAHPGRASEHRGHRAGADKRGACLRAAAPAGARRTLTEHPFGQGPFGRRRAHRLGGTDAGVPRRSRGAVTAEHGGRPARSRSHT